MMKEQSGWELCFVWTYIKEGEAFRYIFLWHIVVNLGDTDKIQHDDT